MKMNKWALILIVMFSVFTFAQDGEMDADSSSGEAYQISLLQERLATLATFDTQEEKVEYFNNNIKFLISTMERQLFRDSNDPDFDFVEALNELVTLRQIVAGSFRRAGMLKSAESIADAIIKMGEGTYVEIYGLYQKAETVALDPERADERIQYLLQALDHPALFSSPLKSDLKFHAQLIGLAARYYTEKGDVEQAKAYVAWYYQMLWEHKIIEPERDIFGEKLIEALWAGELAASRESTYISRALNATDDRKIDYQGEIDFKAWEAYKASVVETLKANTTASL